MAEYIDREAFNKSVEERYCKPCKAEGKDHNGCWCRACWVDDMLDEVDCFQSSDVAPVVHGEWIDDGGYGSLNHGFINQYRCSVCGVRADYCKGAYCSHCGAKMDGGENS